MTTETLIQAGIAGVTSWVAVSANFALLKAKIADLAARLNLTSAGHEALQRKFHDVLEYLQHQEKVVGRIAGAVGVEVTNPGIVTLDEITNPDGWVVSRATSTLAVETTTLTPTKSKKEP